MAKLSLSKLLEKESFPKAKKGKAFDRALLDLQHRMLRVQQGIWHQKRRAIVVFEGFDAAGKGGAIRRLTELLDPRGFRVYPIGPPSPWEQGRHWLYRFWEKLPESGTIAIFDRSWYGRVLVERVDALASKKRWKEAYDEINEFETTLARDGIDLVKIFLAIDKDEQWKRFEERLKDPYKEWKLTLDDLHAREKWEKYVEAADELLKRTDIEEARWHLIPANHKHYAQLSALETITKKLKGHSDWMEARAAHQHRETLEEALTRLEKEENPRA